MVKEELEYVLNKVNIDFEIKQVDINTLQYNVHFDITNNGLDYEGKEDTIYLSIANNEIITNEKELKIRIQLKELQKKIAELKEEEKDLLLLLKRR